MGIFTGHQKFKKGAIQAAPAVTIASAATVDLSTALSNNVIISGSTGPITSFGTVDEGTVFDIVFTGTPTITYHASNMILPGSANKVVAAGDTMRIQSLGAGAWRCLVYAPFTGLTPTTPTPPTSLYDSTFPAGEAITAGQAVFVETLPPVTASVTATVAPVADNTDSVTYKTGMKVTFTGTTKITSVTKHASVGATTCYIQTAINSGVLVSATFSSVTATFEYELAAGTYYFMVDSGGASYTYTQSSLAAIFPINFTGGSFVGGAYQTTDTTSLTMSLATIVCNTFYKNIGDASANTRISFPIFGTGVAASTFKLGLCKIGSPSATFSYRIETDNAGSPSGTPVTNGTGTLAAASLTVLLADTTLTLAGSVTLTDGVKYHLVLFAGTYGSETINASNYFAVGYEATDTTTRTSKTWNGSVWSSGIASVMYYISSSLVKTKVLSLSDKDFTYKNIFYGIADGTVAVGTFPKIVTSGLVTVSGTEGQVLCLSSTPGNLTTTIGGCVVGGLIATNKLLLTKQSIIQSVSRYTTRNATTSLTITHNLGVAPKSFEISLRSDLSGTNVIKGGFAGGVQAGDTITFSGSDAGTLTFGSTLVALFVHSYDNSSTINDAYTVTVTVTEITTSKIVLSFVHSGESSSAAPTYTGIIKIDA